MKKMLFTALVLGLLGLNASAKSITNPLYMPDEGQLLFDIAAYGTDTTNDTNNKVYNARGALSLGLTDRLQIGGYIGYRKIDTTDKKDFTNPGAFAILRLWNTGLDIDLGGRVEFDAFDDTTEGGVADGTDKYGFFARAGADLGVFYLGGVAGLDYWDGLGAKAMSKTNDNKIYNGNAKAFVIVDVMDIIGIGGEAGYKVYDMGGDSYYKGYSLTGRLDINPIPSRLGFTAFVTYEKLNHMDDTLTVGLNAKFKI